MIECMYCGMEVEYRYSVKMVMTWGGDLETAREERRYCKSCAKGLLEYADWRLESDKPKKEEKE